MMVESRESHDLQKEGEDRGPHLAEKGLNRLDFEYSLSDLYPMIRKIVSSLWRQYSHPDPAIDEEDLVQEVWIRLAVRIGDGRIADIRDINKFMYVVSRHAMADIARRTRRHGVSIENVDQELLSRMVDDRNQEPLSIVLDKEIFVRFLQAVENYSSKRREPNAEAEVLRLYLLGMGPSEIARETGLAATVVKMRLSRFRQALAEEMRDED
jgi:RNA polymerase sigma factor (sigma-70 family)